MQNNFEPFEQGSLDEYEFYKEDKNNEIWNVSHIGYIGELLFSFDKEHILNL